MDVVVASYLFHEPITHLVAIADPVYDNNATLLRAKVLWEANGLSPVCIGGGPPPELKKTALRSPPQTVS